MTQRHRELPPRASPARSACLAERAGLGSCSRHGDAMTSLGHSCIAGDQTRRPALCSSFLSGSQVIINAAPYCPTAQAVCAEFFVHADTEAVSCSQPGSQTAGRPSGCTTCSARGSVWHQEATSPEVHM